MKSRLRNSGSTRTVGTSSQSSSIGSDLRAALKNSGTTATGAVLAAIAMTLSACSNAEGIEWEATPSAAPAEVEAPPLEVGSPETIQRGTRETEQAASGASTAAEYAQFEPAHTSPREANDAASAPAATTRSLASENAAPDAETAVAAPAPTLAAVPFDTLHTSGRQLLDSCGQPFVTRGVEQIFGEQLPQGNDWVGLVEEIARSGVNAVRILAGTDTLSVNDVDRLLEVVADHGLVAYVTPYGNAGMRWLEGQDVRAMLARHERYILIDAFGEPTFDDRERFVRDSTEAIREVRSWGYRVPLTVTANQFGRDLPSLLALGAQVVAADPLHNTVLGWQAYWSQGGYYQETYGLSLTEAVDAISRAPFPIQLGLDRVTDFPASDTADYGTLMMATEAHGVGWLWWDWYNPYGSENNLTDDGTVSRLTATGNSVVNAHAASVKNTARLGCVR